MADVTQTDRLKSVRNRCVIEVLVAYGVLSFFLIHTYTYRTAPDLFFVCLITCRGQICTGQANILGRGE